MQELDALVQNEDLEGRKTTSTKPCAVTWNYALNFMNVLSSRRKGVVREVMMGNDFVGGRRGGRIGGPVEGNGFEESQEEWCG